MFLRPSATVGPPWPLLPTPERPQAAEGTGTAAPPEALQDSPGQPLTGQHQEAWGP